MHARFTFADYFFSPNRRVKPTDTRMLDWPAYEALEKKFVLP
jgi:hypothetical protein